MMKRICDTLWVIAVVGVGLFLAAALVRVSVGGAKPCPGCGEAQAAADVIVPQERCVRYVDGRLVVPIKAGDLQNFLQATGWKLMIAGNALDMSQESRQKLGLIVCTDGMDLNRATPWYFDEIGQVTNVTPEMIAYAIFWADPKRD